MIDRTFKKNVRFLVFIVILGTSGFSCTLTATRPIQEMSNAEVALHAAKDLNADSLVPEVYRSAMDLYFKAKREFRLKNFDLARKYALRATKLAEQAEFEAYRMGGATPEISSKIVSPEGADPDPSTSFRQQPDLSQEPSLPKETEPQLSPEPEKGTDYNDYLKEKEAAEAAAQEKKEKDDKKKPDGQTGPKPIPGFPEVVMPRTGSLPPTQPGGSEFNQPVVTSPTEAPKASSTPTVIYDANNPPEKNDGPIPYFSSEPIRTLGKDADGKDTGIPRLGADTSAYYQEHEDKPLNKQKQGDHP